MSITEIGRDGEILARKILKSWNVDDIFQADWMGRKNGKWFVVEVKHKEIFKPPPFYGQGLNAYQADMRMKFYKETGIRCLFLVIDKDTKKIYWNWIDELEKTEHFTTKNGVRIYNLKYFHCAGTAEKFKSAG